MTILGVFKSLPDDVHRVVERTEDGVAELAQRGRIVQPHVAVRQRERLQQVQLLLAAGQPFESLRQVDALRARTKPTIR